MTFQNKALHRTGQKSGPFWTIFNSVHLWAKTGGDPNFIGIIQELWAICWTCESTRNNNNIYYCCIRNNKNNGNNHPETSMTVHKQKNRKYNHNSDNNNINITTNTIKRIKNITKNSSSTFSKTNTSNGRGQTAAKAAITKSTIYRKTNQYCEKPLYCGCTQYCSHNTILYNSRGT